MEDNKKRFINCINDISEKLKHKGDFVNKEYILDFEGNCKSLNYDIDSITNKNRVLRIGVVGEVKAGKSSFINALIFDGKNILPKAATPMTAALTKLSYGNESKAKVVFYTDYDWKRIEEYSNYYDDELKKLQQEYYKQNSLNDTEYYYDNLEIINSLKEQIPEQYRSCKELTDMSSKNTINVNEYLNTSVEILLDNIQYELSEYIGAEGKYTPIVKHIEITLNNPLLRGIELIDTPGLNDPILSRSDATRKFLKNCDVVFLLSYAGQFMTNEDINFITNTLPGDGIGKAVLIGSKLDSAILDFPKRKASLKEALRSSVIKFNDQAKRNIDDCYKENFRSEVLLNIKESLPPKYISSIMYSIAKKNKNDIILEDFEEHIYKTFKKRFEDFNDSYEFLMDFSNIENIKKNIFEEVIAEKNKIIKEKSELLLKGQKAKLISILEEINIQAVQNLNDINTYDKEKLQEKLKLIDNKISSLRREIKNIFDNAAIDSKKVLINISVNIEKEIDRFTDIDVKTEKKEHLETQREGLLGLKKKVYRVTETKNSADVGQVIKNIRRYITRCKEVANSEFDTLINVSGIKKKIKETVVEAFDLSDKNFNENDILIPIEIAMKKIKIPSINIDASDYDDMILRTFSSTIVEGENINQLLVQQEKVLQTASKSMSQILKNTASEVEIVLQEESSQFVDNIISHLSENIKMLENKLEDREKSIREFEEYIKQVADFKEEIRNIKV